MRVCPSRGRAAVAVATATLLTLTACSGDDPDTSGNDGADGTAASQEGAQSAERLRVGILSEEGNLTPFTYETGTPGLSLTMLSYDSLMQIDTDGTPQPWLATSVQASDDGTTYTVELDETATWHDGEPLDAEDVAFSVDYYQNGPPGRFQTALRLVESVTVEDEQTLTLDLSELSPSFELRTLADVPILPEHIWSDIEDPDTAPFNEQTNVGSGPYQLVDSQPGTSYTFEAYEDYFRGDPKVDQIVAIQFADDAGAIAALRSGEVDTLMRTISPEQISSLEGQGGLEVLQAPEYATTLLAYDTQRAPFDDVEFRRALAQAIDVDLLVSDVYLDAAVPGNPGWVHPDSPYYNPDVTLEHDPGAAAAALDAAGYSDSDGDGTRELDGTAMDLELLVYGNNALRLRLAELLSTQMEAVGIGVTVAAVEPQTVDDAVWPGYDVNQGRDYDMAVFGWSAPTQADIGQMAALVSSDTAVGNLNITGFSDPESDELAEQLLSTADEDDRAQVAQDMQVRFAETMPFVPLLYANGAYAYQAEVFSDWVSITGQGPMTKLSFIPANGQP